MTCFAIVRGHSDVCRSIKEIGTLLSITRNRQPEQTMQHFLGLWVHPTMAKHPPACLVQPSVQEKGGKRHVVQTASVSGIWTLCWLESMHPAQSPALSQEEFFGCLLATSGEEAAEGKYIPVFSNETEFADALKLQNSNLRSVLAPLFWDTDKGRFSRLRLVSSKPSPVPDIPIAVSLAA